MQYLESWHEQRAKNASIYNDIFDGAGDIGLAAPQAPPTPARHIWNQFVIRVTGDRRDALRSHLEENGIGSDIYYPVPLHLLDCHFQLELEPAEQDLFHRLNGN